MVRFHLAMQDWEFSTLPDHRTLQKHSRREKLGDSQHLQETYTVRDTDETGLAGRYRTPDLHQRPADLEKSERILIELSLSELHRLCECVKRQAVRSDQFRPSSSALSK